MAIENTQLHPEGDSETILHPETSAEQVVDLDEYISNHTEELRGPKGDTGATGATPNVTANATVDANVGTPSVTVTNSGTTNNPVFTFNFKNLKGEKGDSGSGGGTEVVGNPDITGQSPARLKDIQIGDEYYEITNGVFNLGNVGEFVSNSGGYISVEDFNTLNSDTDLLIEVSTDEGNTAYFRYIGTTDTGGSILYGCVHYGEGIDENENINMYIRIFTTADTSGHHWDLTCMNGYVLPKASATALGGVKVGDGLSMASDGTLSASGGSGGGTQLYLHRVMLSNTDGTNTTLRIFSTSPNGATSLSSLYTLSLNSISMLKGIYTVICLYAIASPIEVYAYDRSSNSITKSTYTNIDSDTVTAL